MAVKTTLKPCPFCGKLGTMIKTRYLGIRRCWVYCDNCGGRGALAETARKAREAWNKRHKETPLKIWDGKTFTVYK